MAHSAQSKRVLIYTLYERLWHWLQAGGILLLMLTGAEIHWSGSMRLFGFDTAVRIHDFLAAVLILNAFLGLFFFVATGNIKHYLPQSRDYFSLALRQGLYYVRGIFRKDPHPFERNQERRLNPIQQVTYIMILNVLIPVQVVTGILMWTSTHYQSFTTLGVVAGLHTLVAWVLLGVIIVHIYMTTTGATPLEHLRTMLFGWGEVAQQTAAVGPSGSAATVAESSSAAAQSARLAEGPVADDDDAQLSASAAEAEAERPVEASRVKGKRPSDKKRRG